MVRWSSPREARPLSLRVHAIVFALIALALIVTAAL